MKRILAHVVSGALLLTASSGQAAQNAAPYVVHPAAAAGGIRERCDAQWRDTPAEGRARAGSYAKFLDQCLERCPTLRAGDTQNYYEGRVRRECDIRWQRKIESNTVGEETYAVFVSDCARACPPQMTNAATAPLPSAPATAAGGAGISTNTGLLIAGGVGAVALIAALASSGSDHNDRPASP